MQVSRRTKFSLSQLLGVIEKSTVYVLLDKFGFDPTKGASTAGISNEVTAAAEDILAVLIEEVVSTNRTLRNQTSPKYQFDDMYSIFKKSLLLDGYKIENEMIESLDPNFKGQEPVEDALLKALEISALQNKGNIKCSIDSSAEDFIKVKPDYNGSLTNIRIALETIVREIASTKGFKSTGGSNTWGPSLTYLKTDG